MLIYLTNLFTQVYITALSAAISEMLGYIVSGWLLERFGLRKSSIISSVLGACGGLSILFFGLNHQDSIIFPILFLLTKMGVGCSYNLSYACMPRLFEVKRASRVLGVANFFARLVSALIPLASTLEQPTPMIIFCTTTICSGILTSFFKEPPRGNIVKKATKTKISVTKVQPFVDYSTNSN